MTALASYWDTLGWVQFQQGSLDQAEKYLLAAWNLGQRATSADHLGQLYEKKGDKARAAEMYARAQASPYPDADSRGHLVALVGEAKADSAIEAQRGKLSEQRSYSIPEIKGDGSADFFVLLAPGSKTEDIRFISGSEKLKGFADSLRSYDFKPQFPDDAETRIIRRGTLTCSGTPATTVLHQAAKKESRSSRELPRRKSRQPRGRARSSSPRRTWCARSINGVVMGLGSRVQVE